MHHARLALLGLLLGLMPLAGCGDGTETGPGTEVDAAWTRLDDLPLSPRSGPVVVATPRGIIAVGGDTGDPCPPNADCAFAPTAARDGARLDPATGTWSPIAPAPRPIPAYTGATVVAGRLFLLHGRDLLDYDVARDRWRVHPGVSPSSWYDVSPAGRRLLLVKGSDEGHSAGPPVLVLDVPTGRWSTLPPDPLGTVFDRSVTATSAGLVMTAHALVPNPGAGPNPTYLIAARYDDRTGWTRLPDATDMLGGGRWSWTGDLMVAVTLDATDGGGDPPGDYGRTIPFGGRLDPRTGAWSRLPDAPEYLSGGWAVDAAGGPLIAAEGWIHDATRGAWIEVPLPDGAAERPGPAAWADRTLYVVGGQRTREGKATEAYDRTVWSWTPPTEPRL